MTHDIRTEAGDGLYSYLNPVDMVRDLQRAVIGIGYAAPHSPAEEWVHLLHIVREMPFEGRIARTGRDGAVVPSAGTPANDPSMACSVCGGTKPTCCSCPPIRMAVAVEVFDAGVPCFAVHLRQPGSFDECLTDYPTLAEAQAWAAGWNRANAR